MDLAAGRSSGRQCCSWPEVGQAGGGFSLDFSGIS